MTTQGRNQGFHVLDEFACEAIHAPSVPPADVAKQGRNEGMAVIEELVFDGDRAPKDASDCDRKAAATADRELKSLAVKLASVVVAAPDPAGAMTRFQQLLAGEVANYQQATEGYLDNSPRTGPETASPG